MFLNSIYYIRFSLFLFAVTLLSCSKENDQPREETAGNIGVTYVYIGELALDVTGNNPNVITNKPIEIRFDKSVNTASVEENIKVFDSENNTVELSFSYFNSNQLVKVGHEQFDENSTYKLIISGSLKGANDESFEVQEYWFTTIALPLILETVLIDEVEYNPLEQIKDISRNPTIELRFNIPVLKNDILVYSSYTNRAMSVAHTINQVDEKTISVQVTQTLGGYNKFTFSISSEIENRIGQPFDGLQLNYYTELDTTLKFPKISDEALLTKIQEQSFKYFWDFGHPVSGLTRERNTSGETVTIGGSGFGVMAIITGIERGFISRQQGVERLETITKFLDEKADRFHGVWPHWLDGTTGKVKPFSTKDNGGDLVESSFMLQALLTARQYLHSDKWEESRIINRINKMWNEVEWDWYTQGGQDILYWHWSEDYEWEMNHKISGWNEALIVYVLAASSSTYPVAKETYTRGWSRSGAMVNSSGNSNYNYTLPLRSDMGGPLFFSHYSFLGLDPRNLSDQYANYWDQNVKHSQINNAYCADNPKQYIGYSADCWGLTASDGNAGYSAHSPNNDRGVITPTAALSSIPYTPEKSMKAIRHFYYMLGDKLWGEYGFYDAFNITESWTANSYLAIDQGPIIIMIENHRSGLLWDLFMSCPEVQGGLDKLGFTY